MPATVKEYKIKFPTLSQMETQLPRLLMPDAIGKGLLTFLKSIPAESPNIHTEFLSCEKALEHIRIRNNFMVY